MQVNKGIIILSSYIHHFQAIPGSNFQVIHELFKIKTFIMTIHKNYSNPLKKIIVHYIINIIQISFKSPLQKPYKVLKGKVGKIPKSINQKELMQQSFIRSKMIHTRGPPCSQTIPHKKVNRKKTNLLHQNRNKTRNKIGYVLDRATPAIHQKLNGCQICRK